MSKHTSDLAKKANPIQSRISPKNPELKKQDMKQVGLEEILLHWFSHDRDTEATCRNFGIATASFHKVASQESWAMRADALDCQANDELILQLIDEEVAPTEEELRFSDELMSKAIRGIDQLDPRQLKPRELILLFQEGGRIEKLWDSVLYPQWD